jgi:hypothetical protein
MERLPRPTPRPTPRSGQQEVDVVQGVAAWCVHARTLPERTTRCHLSRSQLRNSYVFLIGLSTALLLALAAAVRLWLPAAAPLAPALVLFALIHATFLGVQKAGADPQG